MTGHYRVFFGFQKEPFSQNIRVEDMLKGQAVVGIKERFLYAVHIGAIAVITGDVGSGKSSALRFASSTLHPSEYRILYITATSGTIAEIYKQICYSLDVEIKGSSKAVLTRVIRSCLIELTQKKQKPVLIIDEASILRLDVFTELHTITQFEGDSKPVLPIILAGQNNLIDNLMFRQSRALASRIVARGHLEALNLQDMELYLQHHLNIAGCKQNIFSEQAVTAIHQAQAVYSEELITLPEGLSWPQPRKNVMSFLPNMSVSLLLRLSEYKGDQYPPFCLGQSILKKSV